MEYFYQCLTLVAIYGILALSMDLVTGHTGLVSMAHAGFFGVGAYSSAFLATHFHCDFTIEILAGITIAVGISFLLSLTTIRLNDDYFVIGTFVFQMILFSIFNNWIEVTNGSLGIKGVPAILIFGRSLTSPVEIAMLAVISLALTLLFSWRICSSPYGRVLHAIREDDTFVSAQGKNPLYFKVTIFAASAALASGSGSLFAHDISYIDPSSFTVMDSVLILSMVIIGGMGSFLGPLAGACLLVMLPEALQWIGFSSGAAANLRQVIYGGLLVVIMLFRPRGMFGEFELRK